MGSSIEWTEETWNPVVGCTRVSRGCDHCYAVKHTRRLAGKLPVYQGLVNPGKKHFNGTVRTLPVRLEQPLRWRKPRRVFVNSMSDLFHPDVPFEFIDRVFGAMAASPRHVFQILTKRPETMAEYSRSRQLMFENGSPWEHPVQQEVERWINERPTREDAGLWTWPLPNVWLGTSVEDQAAADERIPHLLRTPAAVRFLSCEPLLGPVDLAAWVERVDHCGACGAEHPPQQEDQCPVCKSANCLISTWGDAEAERYRSGERYDPDSRAGIADTEGTSGLHWIIAGGESGPGARNCDLAWLRDLRDQCRSAGVPYFLKQLGRWPVSDQDEDGGFWSMLHEDPYGQEPIGVYGFEGMRNRKGGDPDEWPEDLRVREFPETREAVT